MNSFDDMIRKQDAEIDRKKAEEERAKDQAREMLEKLISSLEGSLHTAFSLMPEFRDPNVTHSSPSFQGGVCQCVVTATAHTELIQLTLHVALGWEPGRSGSVGFGQVSQLNGKVQRSDKPGDGASFTYPFANDVTMTPHCGVDSPTLKFQIGQAISHLS